MFNLHIYVYWISYQCIVLKFVVIVSLNANKCVKREIKLLSVKLKIVQFGNMRGVGLLPPETTFMNISR